MRVPSLEYMMRHAHSNSAAIAYKQKLQVQQAANTSNNKSNKHICEMLWLCSFTYLRPQSTDSPCLSASVSFAAEFLSCLCILRACDGGVYSLLLLTPPRLSDCHDHPHHAYIRCTTVCTLVCKDYTKYYNTIMCMLLSSTDSF
eukprot:20408-Heterococcus_DN1.PRE.5